MNSKYIKYALLKYFRFTRQMLAATEVNVAYGVADILAIDDLQKKSIEVEIKISKSDFKKEFSYKRAKHQYLNITSGNSTPNYFYMAFPGKLADELLSFVPNQYGVIKIYHHNTVNILRQGKRLNHSDNKLLFNNIIKRNNSELIKYYGRCEVDN